MHTHTKVWHCKSTHTSFLLIISWTWLKFLFLLIAATLHNKDLMKKFQETVGHQRAFQHIQWIQQSVTWVRFVCLKSQSHCVTSCCMNSLSWPTTTLMKGRGNSPAINCLYQTHTQTHTHPIVVWPNRTRTGPFHLGTRNTPGLRQTSQKYCKHVLERIRLKSEEEENKEEGIFTAKASCS